MKRKLFILFLCVLTQNMLPAQTVNDELLPLITIETAEHKMPTYTVVYAPEGCIGTSITDNSYVEGRMVMTYRGETLYDSKEYQKKVSGIRIKVRGNSTGASLAQHPYKVKLTKAYDLLGREDNNFSHKEWLLLSMYTWNKKMTNSESNILHTAGLLMSHLVGQPWTPAYDFVQVIINGEYQGMYYLMEAVSKGVKRVDIDDDGFLIEHDTFWWNEDVYFKTNLQDVTYGYTYKYPDEDDITESINQEMKAYMDQVEQAIYEQEKPEQYIDITSFARWMLIHDIMGTDDSAGCNRFLMRKNNKAPLEMGPTWDYDSMFRSDIGWSTIHYYESFFFPALFQNTQFVNTYLTLWKQLRPTILQDIETGMEEVWTKYGDVFDESMAIHKSKYEWEGMNTLRSQIDEVKSKLKDRILLLDPLMEQLENSTAVTVQTGSQTRQHAVRISDLQGKIYIQRPEKGIFIYQFSDGSRRKVIH